MPVSVGSPVNAIKAKTKKKKIKKKEK